MIAGAILRRGEVLAAAMFEIATIERNARDVEPRLSYRGALFANSRDSRVRAAGIVERRGGGEALEKAVDVPSSPAARSPGARRSGATAGRRSVAIAVVARV